jgi:hypothetical protein
MYLADNFASTRRSVLTAMALFPSLDFTLEIQNSTFRSAQSVPKVLDVYSHINCNASFCLLCPFLPLQRVSSSCSTFCLTAS